MIEFKHKLPAMHVEGRENGTYNNVELGFPSILTTLDPKLGMFIRSLRNCILNERSLVFIDGKILMCDKNWIRDHTHVMKAMRHWETDLHKFLDFIIETQREDGQFYELIKQEDDRHWSYVNEDCSIMYPDDNLSLVRLELEADIEYLVVESAVYYYKTCGDNEWLKWALPHLEKGIDYMTSDKKRWNAELGLVIRPFTIDTWDFTNSPDTATNRRINDGEPMSAMHGDNSGVYSAMLNLAWLNRRLGNDDKARSWEERAEVLRKNMFKHLWNGKYFMHQLHIGHDGVDDKENERLSLSNTYDINRGVTDLAQSRSIIEEYMKRRGETDWFAEWFTIDPPYEKFHSYGPGRYVNGAISPFTAGELAKAAFCNGYEAYGWDIIERFMKLEERDGAVYFLYDTDSTPQPEGGPSAWGAAALISAIDEGLAGICDDGVNYDRMRFAPKFSVTPYTELRYITGYEVSGAMIDVRYILTDEGMRYDVYSPAKHIDVHMLVPAGRNVKSVCLNSADIEFEICNVGESKYVDFAIDNICGGKVSIELYF